MSLLFLVLGLGWVPWACVVLFAADRADRGLVLVGGPLGDVVVLFVVQSLVPGVAAAALVGYVLVVAFTASTVGRSAARLLLGVSMALVVAAAIVAGPARLDGPMLASFGVALLAIVALLDRTRTLQQRAVARSNRLEGKADAVLARVADAVVVTDAEGAILECNPAAERMVGLGRESVVGRECATVLGMRVGERPLDCSRGCPLLALVGGAEEGVLGWETWRVDCSGRRQPLLANAEAVLDDRGRLIEVVHSLRDVTRLKQAEEAKTLFLATASHELKTPLTVIRGFADTLLAYPDFDPQRRTEALEAVRRRADELVQIVERLLLSSRIEAGRAEVKMTAVSIPAILAERVAALVGATGREIRTAYDEALPEVAADAHGLVTVVDHLLDNALKYSPNCGPVVVRAEGDGSVVRIEVQDRGIGMDGEQAARCFEKFWQAETTDVRRFGGTGIGLYIVRSLVEAMGGRVEVHSVSGVGTTFAVILARAGALAEFHAGGDGETSSIREFMRQIGVPERTPA